ncbi:serine hydrolase domain-containing protein [uncultured Roseobacter sp.]|uniref:serine hydrolase domain-containing protein n=1 Tax=uncultured Roseobacter sp. TaxID=114847 RepID=UPI002612DD89|nr:serine hydrolase domain-containing protein [uncultured Roseobacter sp.]
MNHPLTETPCSALQHGLTLALLFLRAALICVASLGASIAHPQETWRAELGGFVDGLVTTGLDQDAVAGAVVVIVSSDEVLLSRGYRLSDARTGRLMTPEQDVIPLASITKVFTALAILQLVDTGRIALDDPITRYLPGLELNQRFGDITIVHLLSHTAGLEERYSGYFAAHSERDALSRIAQISAILPRQIRPPEEAIAYSNASYVLLGEIVAQVSGQSFGDYVATSILRPVGIDAPHFMHEPSGTKTPSPFHVWDAGRYLAIDPSPFPAIHAPSGGLALTAEDMGRIMQMLLKQGAVDGAAALSPDAIADLQRPVWPNRAAFAGRTLGYWTDTWAGHTVYYHGGTHFGFHTNMVLIPALDLAFFIAANGPSGSALMGLPRRALREVVAPQTRQPSARVACDADCLHAYTGRFITARRNKTGLDRLRVRKAHKIEIRPTDEGMLLVSGLGYSRLFQATGEDQFETPEGDMRLGFRRDIAGRVMGAHINGGIFSFDRLAFWQSAISLHSGLAAALTGSLLCLAGAVAAWRSKRRAMGMSLWLGLAWLGCVIGSVAILNSVLNGRDLPSQATAGMGLWTLTGLYAAAAINSIWAGTWLARPLKASNWVQSDRLLVLVALPLFAWALLAAWMWNLPTATLTW